jgi:transcriptional regulator with XRE-family HTH domain
MTPGQRIKQRRKQLEISADFLAEKLGVSRSTIFRYENGDIGKMPIDIIKPIAEALQTTPEYLMGWENIAVADKRLQNAELSEYLEHLRTRPELKMLFDTTANATKREIEQAVKIIEALRAENNRDE